MTFEPAVDYKKRIDGKCKTHGTQVSGFPVSGSLYPWDTMGYCVCCKKQECNCNWEEGKVYSG